MWIGVVSLFPEMFEAITRHGVTGRAVERRLLEMAFWNPRDYATDRHRTVDDRPYGGGPGMLLKPEPVFRALDLLGLEAGKEPPAGMVPLLMCPQGQKLGQKDLENFSGAERLVILCGRYEGYDERIIEAYPWRRVSLGDYVLSGGEVAAMAIIEGTVRLLPGVLGDEESAVRDSFSEWAGPDGFDHAHWTRPPEYRGRAVPEVLLSGDHGAIEKWRRENSGQQGPGPLEVATEHSADTGASPDRNRDGIPHTGIPGEEDVEQD